MGNNLWLRRLVQVFRIVLLAEMEPYLKALMTNEVFENQAQAFIKSYKGEISTCPVQTCGQPPLAQMLAGPNGQTCIKEMGSTALPP